MDRKTSNIIRKIRKSKGNLFDLDSLFKSKEEETEEVKKIREEEFNRSFKLTPNVPVISNKRNLKKNKS